MQQQLTPRRSRQHPGKPPDRDCIQLGAKCYLRNQYISTPVPLMSFSARACLTACMPRVGVARPDDPGGTAERSDGLVRAFRLETAYSTTDMQLRSRRPAWLPMLRCTKTAPGGRFSSTFGCAAQNGFSACELDHAQLHRKAGCARTQNRLHECLMLSESLASVLRSTCKELLCTYMQLTAKPGRCVCRC